MAAHHVTDQTRIFMELGSVWVKSLVQQQKAFTALAWHPLDRRIRAKACSIEPDGMRPTLRLITDRGTYEVGDDTCVRLDSGEIVPVAELQPGALLHAGVLKNEEGMISVETIYRDIWLHELIEADTQGYKLHLEEREGQPRRPVQRVLAVQPGSSARGYLLEVDCDSPPPPDEDSGRNVLIWPDGTSAGSGIFLY